MQHKRGICLGCGSEVAVRGDDHLFRHSSQRGEICPRSYSVEWEPIQPGDPGPDTVPPQYRTKLAEEIRSMIPRLGRENRRARPENGSRLPTSSNEQESGRDGISREVRPDLGNGVGPAQVRSG